MEGVSQSRWNKMTYEEQQDHMQSLVYDSDSEEPNSGDCSDGSDEEWKPTAEYQHNDHIVMLKKTGLSNSKRNSIRMKI